MPEPLGKEVVMRCFVGDDDSGKKFSFWFHYILADGTHILLLEASEYS